MVRGFELVMMRALLVLILVIAALQLAGCSGDMIKALAKDPSAISARQQITAPGWTVITEVTRVNSTNTTAQASSAGVAINVPPDAVENKVIPKAPKP
jgi:hypothetical protein